VSTESIVIERCGSAEQPGWLQLRAALWPHDRREQHVAEMESHIAQPDRYVEFIAYVDGIPVGLAEASLRNDYVNGTSSSPVAFLEGLYAAPSHRRRGVAARLVAAVAAWAAARGCDEFASDALVDNEISHRVHKALGFEETERVVYFRKALGARET
jgi:aminoglycoside 6'-N-acetyltransferase I